MGHYKDLEIARMGDPFYGLSDKPVGISCFNNRLLRKYVDDFGSVAECSYSGKREKCLPFVDCVRKVNDIINTYFTDAANEAGYDSHFDDDGDVGGFIKLGGGYIVPEGKTHYTDIAELLEGEALDVNDVKLKEDIREVLPEGLFVEKDLYGLNEAEERTIDWRELVRQSRTWRKQGLDYPNLPISAKTQLFNLLETIQSIGHKILRRMRLSLFRVVKYPDPLENVEFTNLTSPPYKFTRDLRMSRVGESMFYGASTQECAREEAVGSDHSCYYIGEFEGLHEFTMLDLRKLRERVSIFDIDENDYYALVFLQYFAHEISKPVADHNPEDYIPTQFITGYFKNSLKRYKADGTKDAIDGILYDSSKVDDAYNAVLFFDNAESAKHLRLNGYTLIDKR